MIVNKETITELAGKKLRLDNRGLLDYRQPIKITRNVAGTAEGSAQVQIGDTVVIGGVKLSLEKPYNDTADQGGIMVNVELPPFAHPEYEPGPPSIKGIELARVIDRGIREAKAIDMKKLCITPGEKAWFVIIDVVVMNDAGNLFDAIGLAALAALKSATFPVINEETGTVDYKQKTEMPLPIVKQPLPVTIYKINGQLMVDPTVEEEKTADARLTIASDADGTISAMQKGGVTPLTIEEVAQMVNIALEKSKLLRAEL